MYKCKQCGKSSQPGEARQTIIEYHELKDPITKQMTTQIKSETPVCQKCKDKAEG